MKELLLFPEYTACLGLVVGACLGSFLNVCASRIPLGISLVRPPSRCPACQEKIPFFLNIPVLGWIFLRGKAQCCGVKISVRYLLVELFLGIAYAWIFWEFSIHQQLEYLITGCFFTWIMTAVVVIDAETMIIPDRFSMGGAIAGVFLSVCFPAIHGHYLEFSSMGQMLALLDSVQGMLIGAGLLYWIGALASRFLGRDALGEGDIKLLGCVGAFCGWEGALFCIFGGATLGTVFLIPPLIWSRWKKHTKEESLSWGVEVPFGPFLAMAALLYFFLLKDYFLQWIDQSFGALL